MDRALPLQGPTPAIPAPPPLGLCGLPPEQNLPPTPTPGDPPSWQPWGTLIRFTGLCGVPSHIKLGSSCLTPSPAPLTPQGTHDYSLLRVSLIQAPVPALCTKESPPKRHVCLLTPRTCDHIWTGGSLQI